jgi:hypothetical protein
MILERLPGGAYVSLAEDLDKVVREKYPDSVPVHVLTGAAVMMALSRSCYLSRADESEALGEMIEVLMARIRELNQH